MLQFWQDLLLELQLEQLLALPACTDEQRLLQAVLAVFAQMLKSESCSPVSAAPVADALLQLHPKVFKVYGEYHLQQDAAEAWSLITEALQEAFKQSHDFQVYCGICHVGSATSEHATHVSREQHRGFCSGQRQSQHVPLQVVTNGWSVLATLHVACLLQQCTFHGRHDCVQNSFALCVQRAARLKKICAITLSGAEGCRQCHNFGWRSDSKMLEMSVLHMPLLLPDGTLVRELAAGIQAMCPKTPSEAFLCCNTEQDMLSWTGHLLQELPALLIVHFMRFKFKVALPVIV